MERMLNPSGLELIMRFEDFRPKPYDDGGGTLTIGYGHTRSAVIPASITEEEAVELLKEDLAYFEEVVQSQLLVPVNDNQYSALVSFVFNVGEGNFRQSTLLKKINNKNWVAAAAEFEKWNKVGQERSAGLMRRREAEKQLFITPPAPASIEQQVLSVREFVQLLFAEPEKVQKANLKINPAYMDGVVVVARPVFVSWTPGEDEDEGEVADSGDATGSDGNGEGQPTGPVPVP
jgi:lysozyme